MNAFTGMIHPKLISLSLFIHPAVTRNEYIFFLFFTEHKEKKESIKNPSFYIEGQVK